MSESNAHATISLASGYRLQWEEAQNTHVLLFPEGMIRLSESATEILKRCTGEHDQAGIIAALSAAFPGVDLSADVIEFLETAVEQGWVIEN